MDLEAEEFHGIEDIDAKVLEPMTRLPKYISPQKGKAKVTEDPNTKNFTISMPLLPEQDPFKGLQLTRIPLIKMEDLDLAYDSNFPHLATEKYIRRVYYEETSVTMLETEEWVYSVE